MLRPDYQKWNQSLDELRQLAVEAEHRRSRERYQALYMVGRGSYNATTWAKLIGRENETVQGWIHQYNEGGATAVAYRHSGGVPPFLAQSNSVQS